MITEVFFFLFLIETICCDPSSEPSRQVGSDERSNHTFLCRINKKKEPNYHRLFPLIQSSEIIRLVSFIVC